MPRTISASAPSLDALRRHAVARTLFPPASLPAALRRLGFVQADPIRAPARAQDLTLRHRVKGYRAGDLERRYPALDVEEDFFVNYGFLPRATCVTPNGFELAWLSGHAVEDEASAIAAARALGVPEVLATSIPAGADRLATLLITPEDVHAVVTSRLDHVPHGTGDFLSGLYLAHRLTQSPQHALAAATKTLARAIASSAGTSVLNVAGALHSA